MIEKKPLDLVTQKLNEENFYSTIIAKSLLVPGTVGKIKVLSSESLM